MPSKRTVITLYVLLAVLAGAGFICHAVAHRRSARIASERRQILDRRIDYFRADGVPLTEALSALSKQSGVAIAVDPAIGADAAAKTYLVTRGLTLERNLEALVHVKVSSQNWSLRWHWQGSGLVVSSRRDDATRTSLRAYDVSDIDATPPRVPEMPHIQLSDTSGSGGGRGGGGGGGGGAGLFGATAPPPPAPPPDPRHQRLGEISGVLSGTIYPDSWQEAGGTVGTFHYLGDTLLIRQTDREHGDIERILAKLRGAGETR